MRDSPLKHHKAFSFDTVAFAIGCALHCIASPSTGPNSIQNELQMEVDAALAGSGCLSYEALLNMRWLGAVVKETLRLYPIVAL